VFVDVEPPNGTCEGNSLPNLVLNSLPGLELNSLPGNSSVDLD